MHLLFEIALVVGQVFFGKAYLFEKLIWAITSITLWEKCKRHKWPATLVYIKNKLHQAGQWLYAAAVKVVGVGEVQDFDTTPEPAPVKPEVYNMAFAALQTLGFKKQAIEAALARVDTFSNPEQAIKQALKYL